MRVRMLATLSGTRNGEDWPPQGQFTDLPDDEARHMCAAGLAEPDPEPTEPAEPAKPPAPETATAPEPQAAEAPEPETPEAPEPEKRRARTAAKG